MRVVVALSAILIWTKLLYFMLLVDAIAPLVSIAIKVFKDITYFLFVMVVALFAFANAFYLIGRNQVQFDGIKDGNEPRYYTVMGSL